MPCWIGYLFFRSHGLWRCHRSHLRSLSHTSIVSSIHSTYINCATRHCSLAHAVTTNDLSASSRACCTQVPSPFISLQPAMTVSRSSIRSSPLNKRWADPRRDAFLRLNVHPFRQHSLPLPLPPNSLTCGLSVNPSELPPAASYPSPKNCTVPKSWLIGTPDSESGGSARKSGCVLFAAEHQLFQSNPPVQ